MKPMKNLAQYYVDLLVKLGILRFSILLALALVALAVVVQVGITLILNGFVDDIDIIRSVFFGLLITPWAVYFLSVVVDQLEESRQRLSKLVSKLKDMRSRDQELNQNFSKTSLNSIKKSKNGSRQKRHAKKRWLTLKMKCISVKKPSGIGRTYRFATLFHRRISRFDLLPQRQR